MWSFEDEPWQYRLLDLLPSGVDLAQLERARAMTVTQRIEAMIALVEAGEALRAGVLARGAR